MLHISLCYRCRKWTAQHFVLLFCPKTITAFSVACSCTVHTLSTLMLITLRFLHTWKYPSSVRILPFPFIRVLPRSTTRRHTNSDCLSMRAAAHRAVRQPKIIYHQNNPGIIFAASASEWNEFDLTKNHPYIPVITQPQNPSVWLLGGICFEKKNSNINKRIFALQHIYTYTHTYTYQHN